MRTFGGIVRKCGGAFIPAVLMAVSPAGVLPCRASQQSSTPAQAEQAEVTTHDTAPTFQLKSERNLVLVHVVVKDAKGNARGDLQQDDFHLLDNGKPQVITHFSVESPNNSLNKPAPVSTPPADSETPAGAAVPRRFLALFFDDIHLRLEDMMQVKMAALKYVSRAFLPGDRMGVFTASGRDVLEFTDDQALIRQTISKLFPHPIASDPENECPEIFDYQAYMIVSHHDRNASEIAVEEYFACNCQQMRDAREIAQCRHQGELAIESYAMRQTTVYETNAQATIRSLNQVVRHLAAFPGQRIVLVASPGFIDRTFENQLDEIVDRALHANITINTLDAKGLYAPTPGGNDITSTHMVTPNRPDLVGQKEELRLTRITVADDPLTNLADATGGVFFHNNNDLDEGFQKCGALPEVYYVLAYSPTELKSDGSFHRITVKLTQPAGLSLQSRRGYFARKKSTDPEVQAHEEIQEAVFSADDMNELPIEVHTQYFRSSESSAKLSVMTHVDLRFVHFQKLEGKNVDHLTLVTALFDENGKYLTAQQKTLSMHLRDATLTKLSASGITMKTSFDVKPGTYMIRQVVRDAEGSELSGISRSVQIPF